MGMGARLPLYACREPSAWVGRAYAQRGCQHANRDARDDQRAGGALGWPCTCCPHASTPPRQPAPRIKVDLEQLEDVAPGVHGVGVHGVVAGLQHPQGHLPQAWVALILRREGQAWLQGGGPTTADGRHGGLPNASNRACETGDALPREVQKEAALPADQTWPTWVQEPSGPVASHTWGMPWSMESARGEDGHRLS